MPDRQTKREQGERDVQPAPVLDNRAVASFAPHGLLYHLQCSKLFPYIGDDCYGMRNCTLAIGKEAMMLPLATRPLWYPLKRSVRQVQGQVGPLLKEKPCFLHTHRRRRRMLEFS